MSSTLSEHIDTICQRIQDTTSTYDPGIHYVQVTRSLIPNQRDRSFQVEADFQLKPRNTTRPEVFDTVLIINFFYPNKTEEYSELLEVIDDSEDLYARLHYYNGNEYSSSFTCVVRNMAINKTESQIVLSIELELTYSISLEG